LAKRVRDPIAIFLVALAVRLIHVWQIRKAPFFDVLMGDSRGYDEWAQRIAGGEWFGRDVFYQAPLYPYFLGVIYAIAGRSLLALRIVQAIVGASSCVVLAAAARRLFSPTVGLVCGLMLALYAPAIFFDGLLQKSVLDVFFVCLALYFIARIATVRLKAGATTANRSSRGVRVQPDQPARGVRLQPDSLFLGLAIGGLSLTRENALVFILVIALWIVLRRGAAARDALLAFIVGVAIVVAPVAIRNSVVGGGLYITSSQLGPNLFIGNHPGADGSYQSLRYGRGAPEFERQDATELAERALHRSLTPNEVSTYWTDRAIDFMTGQPAEWLRLMGRKIVLLWNATEMVDTEDQATHGDWSWPLRMLGPIGHFGVLVPLAAIGMIVTWRERERLWILYALIATYAVSVVLFYVFARYRYPLVPMLLPFAAVAAVSIRRIPNPKSLIPIAAAVAVFTNWPVASAHEMRAVTETNLGVALQTSHRVDDAIAHYRRAIAERPDYAPAYSNLATALRDQKRIEEAVATYQQALKLQPDFAAAHYNLANLLLDEGDPAAAADHFERALTEEPASADVHNNLGIALAATGRVDDAAREFRAATELDPKSAKAYRNLGDALSTAGHTDEAIAALRQAVSIDPNDAAIRYDLAGSLLETGKLDDAIEQFRAALRVAPRMVEAHNNLGIALGSQGKLDEAAAEFRRALEIQPDFADARKNLEMIGQLKK
jgi:tetratricopeptide (TPR) repeat protein